MRNPRGVMIGKFMLWLDSFGSPLGVPFSLWVLGIASLGSFLYGFFQAKKYLHVDDIPHGGRFMLFGIIGTFATVLAVIFFLNER